MTLIKQEELLQLLGVSRKTLWRWRQLGLPTHRVDRILYFDPIEVKKWVRSR